MPISNIFHNREHLSRALAEPLPGAVAHRQIAPPGRLNYTIASDAREAAVLVLIYPEHERWSCVLIERNAHPLDKHSGQISFPGGKMESFDTSYEACALREANEEVGLDIELIEVVGHLTPLYIPVSLFQVYPIVAWTDSPLSFEADPSEVARIITFPIEDILGPDLILCSDHQVRPGLTLRDVLHFSIEDTFVWGATAMILNELKMVLDRVQIP